MQNTIDAPSFEGIVSISAKSAFLSANTGNVVVAKVGWSMVAGRSCVDGELQYLFGARYYDPELGMWLSHDAAGQFPNPYQYSNNPITYIDEDGNLVFLVPILIGAALGAYSGYSIADAKGYDFGDLETWGYMLGGAVIGGAAGGLGAAAGVAAGGGIVGGAVGGLTGGATQGLFMGAMAGARDWDLVKSMGIGAAAGLVGGGVGGFVGHGVWGAMAGGFAGGATGTALQGGDLEDVVYGGLKGAAISGASYGIQAAARYANKTGNKEFDKIENRRAMSKAAEKSFRYPRTSDMREEVGVWMTEDGPELRTGGTHDGISMAPAPASKVTALAHTHPGAGGPHSFPYDYRGTFGNQVDHFAIGRETIWLQSPQIPANDPAAFMIPQNFGATNNYLMAYSYNTFFLGMRF